jgi:hypothetical protein
MRPDLQNNQSKRAQDKAVEDLASKYKPNPSTAKRKKKFNA